MKQIYAVGETILDIIFKDGQPRLPGPGDLHSMHPLPWADWVHPSLLSVKWEMTGWGI